MAMGTDRNPIQRKTIMTDKQEPEKTDWSYVEARIRSKEGSTAKSEVVPHPLQRSESDSVQPTVSAAITVPFPDTEEPRGILMQWKRNQMDRQMALKAIQAQYDAQLDALGYHLKKAVTVSTARADLMATEFLQKLDSDYQEIRKALGLRNTETRARTLIDIRVIIAAKLEEVQKKNWPEPLKQRTIDDLMDLEKRACAEIMKELGA
jgi:hypothetical protein